MAWTGQHHRAISAATPALLIALASTLGGCETVDTPQTLAPIAPGDISGRYVLVMGDAEMRSVSRESSLFTPRAERDHLTVISLPIAASTGAAQKWTTRVAQVPVGNSVLGPPGAIAVTPDGTRAYICEPFAATDGQAGNSQLINPQPGNLVTPIDLKDPAKPAAEKPLAVGRSPVSVDVHPGGKFVAVGTAERGQQIALLRVGAESDKPLAFPLLGIEDEAAEVGALAWHPTGRYLAVALPSMDKVAFYEFELSKDNGLPALAEWGAPVPVPPGPAAIRFTPDGKHLLVTCAGRAASAAGPSDDGPEGSVAVIALSRLPSESTTRGNSLGVTIEHAVTDTQSLGQLPEGLAVSPDGASVAIASWRRAAMFAAGGDAGAGVGGELRLLSLDAATGKLAEQTRLVLTGIPTGLSFDARGQHLLVAQLRGAEATALDGELAFFRIERTATPPSVTLTPADFAVGVGVGPHGNVIVR